jgi:hypothetical protein
LFFDSLRVGDDLGKGGAYVILEALLDCDPGTAVLWQGDQVAKPRVKRCWQLVGQYPEQLVRHQPKTMGARNREIATPAPRSHRSRLSVEALHHVSKELVQYQLDFCLIARQRIRGEKIGNVG